MAYSTGSYFDGILTGFASARSSSAYIILSSLSCKQKVKHNQELLTFESRSGQLLITVSDYLQHIKGDEMHTRPNRFTGLHNRWQMMKLVLSTTTALL